MEETFPKLEMKQIYFCERNDIKYSDDAVEVNMEKLPLDIISGSNTEHYAYKLMREHYAKVLSRQYENIVVLSGAGTSVEIGVGDKKGKTMRGLWSAVVSDITFEALEKFSENIQFGQIDKECTDLEALLSKAILSEAFYSRDEVREIIDRIETIIRRECSLELPDNAPHDHFLRKLTARKLKYSRAKIFNLNYDLLFEQAASKGGYVVIDGFCFNTPRVFNGVNYDYDIVIRNNNRSLSEENFAPKVIHLYKPHGSLDWDRYHDTVVKSSSPLKAVMIYPSSSKYEASYEQPYFEMMSRFQNELRKKNTLLLVIGFSFYDKHITAMINEALNSNPSITIAIVSPDVNIEKNFKDLKEKSQKQRGVILINETFEDFTRYYPYSEIYDYVEGEMQQDESL